LTRRISATKRKGNRDGKRPKTALTGQIVGVREIGDQIWRVSFPGYDLGYFDQETGCTSLNNVAGR